METGRVVIAGGSGFLGRLLASHLQASGRDVVVLTRNPKHDHDVAWDARTVGDWVTTLDGADAIVNLVGRTVDCIKTPDHRDEILRSRVEATVVLGEAVRTIGTRPRTWVQMSTAHIYGDPPSIRCTESSPIGLGLAPTVGVAWERAFEGARPDDMRGVVLRTSFVIGRGGGALARLRALTRFGLGGRVGHGRQGMSWIHTTDMNRIFEKAITDDAMEGVYIATGPDPVSQAEFMRALRRALGMPIGLPAPAWLVRIGAPLVMRTDPELALYGRYCLPARLLEEGFDFRFPAIDDALRDLIRA